MAWLTAVFSYSSFMSVMLLLPLPDISEEMPLMGSTETTHRFDNHGFLRFPNLADDDTPSNPSNLVTDMSCSDNAVHSSDLCNYCLDFRHDSTGDLRLFQVKLAKDTFIAPKGCKVQIENAGNLTIEAGAFYGAENIISLKITNNNIKYLGEPQELFSGLTELQILNLANNNILRWETINKQSTNDESHKTLPNLKILILSGNPINHLSNQSLLWLQNSSITHLSLNSCGIDSFENGFLIPIANKIRVLELGAVPAFSIGLYELLSCLDNLNGLGLAHMGISRIPTTVLEKFSSSLQYLSLHGNLIHAISSQEDYRRQLFTTNKQARKSPSFPYMENLEEIDLRSCSIYFIEANAFDTLPNLKVLLLSRNLIINFHCFHSFYVHRELTHLDLSYNPLGEQEINVTKFPALESLDLSYTQANSISFHTVNEQPHLKRLSINYGTLRVIHLEDLQNLSSLEILELAGNKQLGKNLNGNAFCDLINLKELNLAGCSFVPKPEVFRCLKSLRKLNIMSNGITFLSDKMLKHLPLLESLNVNDNMIKTWNKPVFSFNSNLKYLSLAQNHITYLSEAMFSDFSKLKMLDVSTNPFICDCYILKFVQFVQTGSQHISKFTDLFSHQNLILSQKAFPIHQLKNSIPAFIATRNIIHHFDYQHSNTHILIKDWNRKGAYLCSYVHDLSNESFNINTYNFMDVPQNICELNKEIHDNNQDNTYLQNNETQKNGNKMNAILVYGTVMLVTVSALMSVGIMYRKWQYVRYYAMLIKNSKIFRRMSTDKSDNTFCSEKIYTYDVFVSYSDQNRDWILNELLPNLESKTEISVCLHERDFQVGTGIVENIITHMDVSKCVLLVISQQFLRSRWCQFELQLAQYRLLEAKQELILVFLEGIPKHNRHKSLTYLMKTKTYIVWPQDGKEEERNCFWSRLNRAVLQYTVLNGRVKCMSVV